MSKYTIVIKCWLFFESNVGELSVTVLQLFYFLVHAQNLHACQWLLNTWRWDPCII